MREILTHSAISTFLTCPQKYEHKYIRGINPINKATSLTIGIAVHKGLQVWFESGNAEMAFNETWAYGIEPADQVKAQEMVRAYIDTYHDDWEVVAVEHAFEQYLRNPDTRRPAPYWMLCGKVDALVRIDGELWIVEHKTTTDMGADYWARTEIDEQIQTYALAIEEEFKEPVYGVVYDVLKKPLVRIKGGETDEEFEARKEASKTGRIKRREAETLEEFRARVAESISSDNFGRKCVLFTREQLQAHASALCAIAKRMAELHKGRSACFRNTGACLGFTSCPYLELCRCNNDLRECSDQYETAEINEELNNDNR